MVKCEDCGNDKGRKITCPYAEDIDGMIEYIIVCDDCESNRAGDI